MKTIKYIAIMAILSLMSINSLSAQQNVNIGGNDNWVAVEKVKNLSFDPTKWLDTWIAKVGDMTYELSFKVDTVRFAGTPLEEAFGRKVYETLEGTLIYKRNGVVVRTIVPSENPLYTNDKGSISLFGGGEKSLILGFHDKVNKVDGELYFNLVEGSSTKAIWSIQPAIFRPDDWGEFDLPLKMTFTKVLKYSGSVGSTIVTKPANP